jgi:hypothetical protein
MSNERQLLRTVEFALETFIESGYFPNEQLLLDTIKELFNQPKHIVAADTVEPVAWMYDHHIEVGYDKHTEFNIVETCARNLESENCINVRPLYLGPPKQKPLTPHQISEGNQSMLNVTRDAFVKGVKFAEKMHGIGGD